MDAIARLYMLYSTLWRSKSKREWERNHKTIIDEGQKTKEPEEKPKINEKSDRASRQTRLKTHQVGEAACESLRLSLMWCQSREQLLPLAGSIAPPCNHQQCQRLRNGSFKFDAQLGQAERARGEHTLLQARSFCSPLFALPTLSLRSLHSLLCWHAKPDDTLTTRWRFMHLEFSMSFPHAAPRVPCMFISNPFLRRNSSCLRLHAPCTIHHAPCTICHSPFSNCQSQSPIANWNRNGKHGPKCLSIDKPSQSRCQSRCQNRCHFDARVAVKAHRSRRSFWAVTHGFGQQKSRKLAKWPLGQAKCRPNPQVGYGFGFRFKFRLWHSWAIMLDLMGNLSNSGEISAGIIENKYIDIWSICSQWSEWWMYDLYE